jgi:hypothetical protein
MNQTDQMRSILNLLESVSQPMSEVKQGKIGRLKGTSSSDRMGTINSEPVPYVSSAGKSKGEDWMRKAAGIDDDRSERVYLNPNNPNKNRRILMLATFDPNEQAWIYMPDNGARTMGGVNARIITNNLVAMGLKDGRDF